MPEEMRKEEQSTTKEKRKKALRELRTFAGIFVLAFLLLHVIISIHPVPSSSMEPTIKAKSIICLYRLPYVLGDPAPSRGEVVVFYDKEDEALVIKRVIGVSGDTISFQDGYVYLNGELLEEPYLKEQGRTFSDISEFVVPEGSFFAMGDNREDSFDSRH